MLNPCNEVVSLLLHRSLCLRHTVTESSLLSLDTCQQITPALFFQLLNNKNTPEVNEYEQKFTSLALGIVLSYLQVGCDCLVALLNIEQFQSLWVHLALLRGQQQRANE